MNKLIRLTFVLIIMLIIFMFSNQVADDSTKVSDGLILKMSNILSLDVTITDNLTFIVRKTAHFIIYLLLGISVINFIVAYDKKTQITILISIIICLLYSITDEFHQSFIPGRSAEIRDIFIDTIGGTIGIIIYHLIYKKRRVK